MSCKIPSILVTLISLLTQSTCWWDTGHMLVAKIAELSLQEESKP